MLGLKHNVNLLVDYDPRWLSEFEAERRRILDAIGPAVESVEHIGSTSVPGLRAKPILDILVGVRPLDRWRECRTPLESLGYDYAENGGVPGHYIFGRGRDDTERTHLVHIVEYGGDSWRSNLAFRDALRSDAVLRAAYVKEKERAAAACPEGRARYNIEKGSFIQDWQARSA